MVWYYAQGALAVGPFEDEQFQRLVTQGRIFATTLVWREGMPDWRTFQEVARPPAAVAAQVGGELCSQCGRFLSTDDMLRFRRTWICAGCKPLFFQRLREGADGFAVAAGAASAAGGRYAGFWIRSAAAFMDGLALGAAEVTAALLLRLLSRPVSPGAVAILAVLGFLVRVGIVVFYETYFVGRFGGTPGKLACGLRVVVSDGRRVSYGRAFGRLCARGLSALVAGAGALLGFALGSLFGGYGVGAVSASVGGMLMSFGYYMAAFDREKRAMHDHMCGTRVVWQ